MGHITSQVQRSINALKAAGYKRSEFSVQCETYRWRENGRKCVEYGDPRIIVRSPLKRQIELSQAVAQQGIEVTFWVTSTGRLASIGYNEEPLRKGMLFSVVDFRKDPTDSDYLTSLPTFQAFLDWANQNGVMGVAEDARQTLTV